MLNCSFVGGRVKNVYAITTLIHIQFLAEHVKCAYSCHNYDNLSLSRLPFHSFMFYVKCLNYFNLREYKMIYSG
jgi:hypothetical protein